MSSKHLSLEAEKGFLRTGDLFLPGGEGFPRFSETGFLDHIDEILDYLPAKDRSDLIGLMALFSRLPTFLIRLVLFVARHARFFPSPVATVLRLLDVGLKGIFYTLYYSEESVFPLIHWDAQSVA
jgi:hypothetical protein